MNKLKFLFKDILKTTPLIISIIIIIAAIADLYRPMTYRGNVLPGQVGSIEGTNRAAEEGKDKDGFLTCGSYVQLEQINIKYNWNT